MAEEATQTAAIMVRVMNNIDIVAIGAVAGFAASKLMGRNKNQGMNF